jgi:hypothetical protein
MWVEDLGLRVWVLGFGVLDSREYGSGYMVQVLLLKVESLGFGV